MKSLATLSCILLLQGLLTTTCASNPQLRKSSSNPLGNCEGDCDKDSDCKGGLACYKTQGGGNVPGCKGQGKKWMDFCYVKPKKLNARGAPPVLRREKAGQIHSVGTTKAYVTGSNIYNAQIKIPSNAQPGDLLVLVLHRTDDFLPMGLEGGWKRAAECFKHKNGRPCATFKDCKECIPTKDLDGTKNLFCEDFDKGGQFGSKTDGRGRDLAQSIFYREAQRNEDEVLTINFSPFKDRIKPAWMFLMAIRGANTKDPIRDWSGTGNDSSRSSDFPSVFGKKGDLVLLSQGFDAGAPGVKEGDFLPPKGFDNFVSMFDCNDEAKGNCDESGYLFGGVLKSDGYTDVMSTRGNGNKRESSDSLVSLTIIPKHGSKGKRGLGASELLGTEGRSCPR